MKKSIFTILLTFVAISAMWSFSNIRKNDREISVVTVKPILKNIHDYINTTGRIKDGGKNNVYVDRVCKVEKLYVDTGDHVQKGDVVADVILSEFEFNSEVFADIELDDIITVFEEYESGSEEGIETILNITKTATQKMTIKSPASGMITEMGMKEGRKISSLKKAFSVSDFSDLYIELMVPEEYSLKLKEKEKVELSSEAFGGKIYGGRIKSISPIAKHIPSLMGEGETYIEVIADFDKKDNSLRPGLSVNAKIRTNTIDNALVLPYECILQDEKNREYVFCLKDGNVEKRFISTGYELSDSVQITKGIKSEDVVVINPDKKLTEKSRIKEIEKG